MKFYAKVRLIENYVIVKTGFLLIRNQFCFEMPCLCIYYIGGGSQNGGFEFKNLLPVQIGGFLLIFPLSSQLAIKVVAYQILFFLQYTLLQFTFFTFKIHYKVQIHCFFFILTIKELRINVM